MKPTYFFCIALLPIIIFSCSNKKEEASKIQADSLRQLNARQIVGVAGIEPKERIVTLYSETGGIVRRINHDVNDTVKAGEIIVELSSEVEKSQLKQSRSKIQTQQALINSTKSQLASIRVKFENAKTDYERNQRLIQSGAITRKDLEDSKFNFESAQKDLEAAEASVKQQESKLAEMQADVDYYEEIVKRKEIIAPASGRVLSIDVKVGNNITPSQGIGDFAPAGPLIAVTEIDELFANEVKVGMKAYLRPQGKLDTIATGKVFLASPYLRKKSLFADAATNMEDRRVREVRVILDSGSDVLIGSRVECVILTK